MYSGETVKKMNKNYIAYINKEWVYLNHDLEKIIITI